MMMAAVIFYQMQYWAWFPETRFAPDFLSLSFLEFESWQEFAIALVRGAGPVSGVLLFFFWLIAGPPLEERAGAPLIVLTFFAGVVGAYWLGYYGLVAWEQHYWPGLAGMMACLGLAYYFIWEREVRCFYFMLPNLSFGYANYPLIFLFIPMHLLLPLIQYVTYNKRGQTPPDAIRTMLWLFVLPFAIVGISLALGKLLQVHRERRMRKLIPQ